MLDKIFPPIKNQKYSFLLALIGTLLVFNIGIFMGYMIESSRIDKIQELYANLEIKILDQIMQSNSMAILDLDCSLLKEENIRFGDEIFMEALLIQKYENANIFTDEIISQHKRFDLLRAIFWINSIKIKEECISDFHTVVYFYQYNDPSIEQKAKQIFFSNLLSELKNKFGNEIMLIPLSADNDIPSINLMIQKYNITELPVILIDEQVKVTEIENINDLDVYLN
jgi:hypothetical protein